ncbi:MAG: ferritin-like domain-containing protein [Deltaproteobacteria bacterium]|nr:ferritin-like domain-containing protein [Deltaproteobacteria bacterium]
MLPAQHWINHFEHNRDRDPKIPWNDPYRLSATEREIVTRSLQDFELGENARGRSFRIRGRHYAIRSKDSLYPRALQLFIWEEQRHSAYLRRFLLAQGIPCKKAELTDTIFRRLRKLADLDCMISVLLTAEIMAMSYYGALYHATESPALRAICRRILRDEVPHLQFQSETLGKVRKNYSPARRISCEVLQMVLLIGTSIVVWVNYARVFKAAHVSCWRVVSRSLHYLWRTFKYSRGRKPETDLSARKESVYAR